MNRNSPRHAPVDEPLVRGAQHVRADAELLDDAGAEGLDEDVGRARQAQQRGHALVGLEVQRDGALAAADGVVLSEQKRQGVKQEQGQEAAEQCGRA